MNSPLSYDRLRELLEAALRWADWCAGEGIGAVSDDVPDPEDFLFDYSAATGDEAWDTMAERLPAALLTRIADLEGALKPFAAVIDENVPTAIAHPSVGDYRRARAALRALSDTDTGEKLGG